MKAFRQLHTAEYVFNNRYVTDIDLSVPARRRWVDFASRPSVKRRLTKLCKEFAAHLNEGIEVFAGQPGILPLLSGGAGMVGLVGSLLGHERVAELSGIARATQLPLGILLLGNLVYDLTQLAGAPAVACSSFSLNIDGKPVLFRNLDWAIPTTMGEYTHVFRFHKNGHTKYYSVGVLGMTGVLSAFKPGAWALTLNQAPSGAFDFSRTSVSWHLREVCDSCDTFEGLLAQTAAGQTMSTYFAHLVGREPAEHAVVNGLGHRSMIVRGETCQTNHYTTARLAPRNPKERFEEGGFTWLNDSFPRLRKLKELVAEGVTDHETGVRMLRNRAITSSDTKQQMVFEPASSKSLLFARM